MRRPPSPASGGASQFKPRLLPSGAPARGGWGAAIALVMAFLTSGCGNQMFRQPSYQPLDSPRAMPPADSVPVNPAFAPDDARPVVSPAWGDNLIAQTSPDAATFPSKEPDLPPPNLSDNARNEPAPASVNALQSPIPLDDAHVISGGHLLFFNRCVQCHNASGYGYGTVGQYLLPHPPDLASPLVQHISDGAMFWHITMGQGKMPGFRHWTTPTERWALVGYVRSLKHIAPGDTALADTTQAPYPVYGQVGFENNRSVSAYRVLPGRTAGSPTEAPLKAHVDHGVATEPGAFGSYNK
jgi:mono/diheme cytochrome c family protein